MAQQVTTVKGDPNWVKSLLQTIALTNSLQIIEKTNSAGQFIVLYDDAAPTGQTVEVLRGDPTTINQQLNVLIAGGATIEIICTTFSASYYLVVYS